MILDTEKLCKQHTPEKRFWFDTETTGTDSKRNGIHELACIVEIDGIIREKKVWNIKPAESCIIEDEALKVSGVTREVLETYPPESEVYEQIISFLSKYVSKWDKKDKFKLYGYNVHFDMQMFIEFFNRNNDKWFFTWFWSGPIDVMSKAAELFMHVRPMMKDFKLGTVVKELEINCLDNFHGALFDIEITREVYYKIDRLQRERIIKEYLESDADEKSEYIKNLKAVPVNPNDFLKKMTDDSELDNIPKVQTEKKDKLISDYNFKFTFGKNRNKTLREVLDTNANYIIWCHENKIQNLEFSDGIIEEARELEEQQQLEFKEQQKQKWRESRGFGKGPWVKDENLPESFEYYGGDGFDDCPF